MRRSATRAAGALLVAACGLGACAAEPRPAPAGVAVHRRGHGPPVVLVGAGPGVCGDADLEVFAPLARDHTLVAFDTRGCGASPSARAYSLGADLADLAALVAAQPEPPWVIGHSYGAILALALGADRPAAARGLVLIAPAADGASLRAMAAAREARLGDARATWRALGARLSARTITAGELTAWWTLEGRAQVARPEVWPGIVARTRLAPEPLLAIQRDLDALDLVPRLPRVRGPVAIVGGAADAIVGDAPARLHAALAGSAYLEVDAGHWPHHEVPAVVPWIEARLADQR